MKSELHRTPYRNERRFFVKDISQEYRRHLKILSARRVTSSNFQTDNPQILRATIKKFSHHGYQGLCTSDLDFTSYCLWSLQGPFQLVCSGPWVPIALSPSSLWSGHCPFQYKFTFFPNLDHVWRQQQQQQQQVPPNCWQPPTWCHNLEATQVPWIVRIAVLEASHCLDYCRFPSSPNCFS